MGSNNLKNIRNIDDLLKDDGSKSFKFRYELYGCKDGIQERLKKEEKTMKYQKKNFNYSNYMYFYV